MFKGEDLQNRILSVEDRMLTPELSANLEISNKLLSRCSYGSCESDVKSIKYLTVPKDTNRQQVDSIRSTGNAQVFPSIRNSSTERLDFQKQQSNQADLHVSSNDVQAYTYGRHPSVYEKLCIEIKFDDASHELATPSTFHSIKRAGMAQKPGKPKVMIFGDVMEPRKREGPMTTEYLSRESRSKTRASSPTDPKTHSLDSLSNLESASVYQKSKTLLRKASGLFTDKPPRETRGLVKSQSNISLREAARSSSSKSSVINRAGSMSRFVGSMKHRLHHVLSKEKRPTNASID